MGGMFAVFFAVTMAFTVLVIKCEDQDTDLYMFLSAPSPSELIIRWGPPGGIPDLNGYTLTLHETLTSLRKYTVKLPPEVLVYSMKDLKANFNYTVRLQWGTNTVSGSNLEKTVTPLQLYEQSLKRREQLPATLIFYGCIVSSCVVYVVVVVIMLVYYYRHRRAQGTTVDINSLSRDKDDFYRQDTLETSERYSRTEDLLVNKTSSFNACRLTNMRTHGRSDDNTHSTFPRAHSAKPPRRTDDARYENQQIDEVRYLDMNSDCLPPPPPPPPHVPENQYATVTDPTLPPELPGYQPYETPIQTSSAVSGSTDTATIEDGYITMERRAPLAPIRRAQSTNQPSRSPRYPVRRNASLNRLLESDNGSISNSGTNLALTSGGGSESISFRTQFQEFATSCPINVLQTMTGDMESFEDGFEITLTLKSRSKHGH